jgi:ArsR family transcriptional regulator
LVKPIRFSGPAVPAWATKARKATGAKVQTERCVTMLKALADEHRWEMVRVLLDESLSVSQLGERLQMPQPNVTKHLRILRAAGLVITERVGTEVRSHIAPVFRAELNRNQNRLDLGCCAFDFNSSRR